MGAAFFITLERRIDGIDPFATNGKAIARCSDELDAVAEELNVTPLGQLFSMSADDVEQILDLDGISPDDLVGLPQELQDAVADDVYEINDAFGALKTQITEHGLPSEEWFEASDGLQTVQRLLVFLRTKQDRITTAEDVIGNLEEIGYILKAARQHNVRFHLSVDI
jgi:hypothetical protein